MGTPLLNWHRGSVKSDIIAGITVALILIPQSLAYAQLAGLPVTFGLYAALVPPFIAAFFGSSRHLSTGPVAVLSLMTAAALTPYAQPQSPQYFAYAILLASLLGIFQILLGLLRMGGIISFLSHPVIYGFTNASALIIATTQLSKLFGVTVNTYEHHYQTVLAVLKSAHTDAQWHTFAFGMAAFASMYILRKINRKLPGILIVVVLSTVASMVLRYDGAIVGHIPAGLPIPVLPTFDIGFISSIAITVCTMALIAFTEAISVAQAIAVRTNTKVDANKELMGQGLSNIIGSVFQSYPVAGSFSRTAVNYQAGGQTWMSSLFTSAVVFVVLLFFTRGLYYLPQVVLAAIIIFSVAGLLDFRKIVHIWNTNMFDAVAAFLTFIGTLYFAPHLEKGILLGVIFSMGHYMYRNARPRIVFLSKYKDGLLHDAERFKLDRCENIAVVRLDAPLFFANAGYFEQEIIAYLAKNKHVQYIIITGSGINYIDASGEEMIASMVRSLRLSRKSLYFADIKMQVKDVLMQSGFVQELGSDHFYPSTRDAVRFLIRHLEHADRHRDTHECPLEKYVREPVEERHVVKDKRDTIAYFYRRLRWQLPD